MKRDDPEKRKGWEVDEELSGIHEGIEAKALREVCLKVVCKLCQGDADNMLIRTFHSNA